MRYEPGFNLEMSNESITSFSLIERCVNDPDILPTAFSLGDETGDSPLTAILNEKGLKTKKLFDGMSSKKYRVVSSNHVQYAIESSDKVKLRFVENENGVTFVCDAYATEPGKYQSIVKIYLDSNWAGPNEVLELDDNNTQIFVWDSEPPTEVTPGVFEYKVKILTNEDTDYIDRELMLNGAEAAVVMTAYEHDFSETGNEKYTFDSWGHSYMGLQRVKYSYSGTAAAMKEGARWTIHNGQRTFLSYAHDQMIKRAGEFHEYSIIYGKTTVDQDGKIHLKNKKGRPVMTGNGIMYQGDGAYEYPYNEWTEKYLETVMRDIDLRIGKDGVTECVLIGGKEMTSGFSKLMRKIGVTQNENVEGTGADKGINMTYSYYEFDGVRVIPRRWRWLDGQDRATKYLDDGSMRAAYEGFIVPLGKTAGGDNQIELVQLRAPKEGSVDGINVGGKMASSVDGSSVHLLFQTGVISRAKIARIFKPYQYAA